MKQYLDLLRDIVDNGIWKEPAREGMPRTKEVFCRTMTFDLSKGFPLLTTKKMYTKGIVAELLWFLRGDTNIKYLVDNNVHIWDADAYKFYKREGGKLPKEEWLKELSVYDKATGMILGECGNIYGKQWRGFDGNGLLIGFDQIKHLLHSLKENPNSRYHIVSAWNPIDFLGSNNAALPACHMMFQCCINNGKLDLMMLQRSCDTFLGVPFNIASYALLTHILAKECGLEPGTFTWVGNCCHIYENHVEQVNELLTREPMELCTLEFDKKNIDEYEIGDFHFKNYVSHSALRAPLSVGV